MFDQLRSRIANFITPSSSGDAPVSTYPYDGLNSRTPQNEYTPFSVPQSINGQESELNLDQIRADGAVPPWRTVDSLDNYGRESDEMRRLYREYHRTEPAIRAAIVSKVSSVAALDVSVIPHPRRHRIDKDAAAFVKWTIDNTIHGWPGLIRRMIEPALVDGFSVSEVVLRSINNDPVHNGKWGLQHVKSRDTDRLRLQIDSYRNVVGVTNLVRGAQSYSMKKIILYSHCDMYDNPYGTSDLRSCYRTCILIDEAYKLWRVALNMFSGPILSGRYASNGNRKPLEAAMAQMRQSGYIALKSSAAGANSSAVAQDSVEVLNVAAATDFASFERHVSMLRQDAFLAIRGGYLPFLESSQPNAVGNTAVNRSVGSDPLEYMLATSAAKTLQFQLFPHLVYPNYGTNCGLPSVSFGGTDWSETSKQMDAAARKKSLGGSVSSAWLDEISGIPPATSPEDELNTPKPGGGNDNPPAAPPSPVPEPGPKPGGSDNGESGFPSANDLGLGDETETQAEHFSAEDWSATTGVRGGHKWTNRKTGAVTYQATNPGGEPTGAGPDDGNGKTGAGPGPETHSPPDGTAPAAAPSGESSSAFGKFNTFKDKVLDTKIARFVKTAEHKLSIVAHKTRAIATQVAIEKGQSPEQAARLGKVLAIADFLGGYVTGAAAGLTMGPAAGKVAMFMPSASALYLAYSTARNPRETWKAALTVVKNSSLHPKHAVSDAKYVWSGGPTEAHADGHVPEWVGKLADVTSGDSDDAEFRYAVFLAALATAGDPDAAVSLARDSRRRRSQRCD